MTTLHVYRIYRGRCYGADVIITRRNMDFQSETKEYAISVRTNDIHEAIAMTGSALYDLLEQALMTADDEDESDFDQFARETLNVLARHPEQLSGGDSQWGETALDRHDPGPSESD
ncbi:MAG: hypothetical protein WAQ52_00135 [Terriglobales bacterium]